jgi:hypothetical protein
LSGAGNYLFGSAKEVFGSRNEVFEVSKQVFGRRKHLFGSVIQPSQARIFPDAPSTRPRRRILLHVARASCP